MQQRGTVQWFVLFLRLLFLENDSGAITWQELHCYRERQEFLGETDVKYTQVKGTVVRFAVPNFRCCLTHHQSAVRLCRFEHMHCSDWIIQHFSFFNHVLLCFTPFVFCIAFPLAAYFMFCSVLLHLHYNPLFVTCLDISFCYDFASFLYLQLFLPNKTQCCVWPLWATIVHRKLIKGKFGETQLTRECPLFWKQVAIRVTGRIYLDVKFSSAQIMQLRMGGWKKKEKNPSHPPACEYARLPSAWINGTMSQRRRFSKSSISLWTTEDSNGCDSSP